MALSDKTLICVECGGEFIFTAGETGNFLTLEVFLTSPSAAGVAAQFDAREQRGAWILTSHEKCTP